MIYIFCQRYFVYSIGMSKELNVITIASELIVQRSMAKRGGKEQDIVHEAEGMAHTGP